MTEERRLEISLRLKAARFLAGHRATAGKHAGTAVALSVQDLAERLKGLDNAIAIDRLQAFEQMRGSPPRAMELEKVATALGLPATWFAPADQEEGSTLGPTTESLVPLLLAGAQALRRESESRPLDEDAQGRSSESAEENV